MFSRIGERIEKRAGLEDHGDAPANLHQVLFRPVGDVFAGHDDAPFIGLQEAHDVLQRDGFADAAAPHDDAGLPGIDGEADAVEHQVIAERFGDVAEFDVVVHFLAPELRHRSARVFGSYLRGAAPVEQAKAEFGQLSSFLGRYSQDSMVLYLIDTLTFT